MTVEIVFLILAAFTAVLSGVANKIRGGWYGLEMGGRPLTALVMTIPFAFTMFNSSVIIPFGIPFFAPILFMFAAIWFGFIHGWGSYFANGNFFTSFSDKPEVGWIDRVLYWMYGPKWIPSDWQDTTKYYTKDRTLDSMLRYDNIISPTGKIRDHDWSRKRAITGMYLRGLHLSVPIALVFGFLINPIWYAFAFAGLALGLQPIHNPSNTLDQLFNNEFVFGVMFSILISLFTFVTIL